LGLAERTVQHWEQRRRQRRLRLHGRGRPAHRCDRPTRQRVLALLALLGPHVGAPTVQAFFPEMARREVQDFLRRYRRVWRRRYQLPGHVLRWTRPGTVWAIDFAEPPLPVEGSYPYLLAVRDLASGLQLLWLPVPDETAATAAVSLELLFRQYGPPLVLKSDNGSGFIAGETRSLLSGWGVGHLRSPPELPEYNGACEAGIGSMKTRTVHAASRGARPAEWTGDDAEAARLQANQTARPWGVNGPTPEQAWGQRLSIPAAERSAFGAAVQRREQAARRERGFRPGERLPPAVQAAIDREALSRALVARGYLAFSTAPR
jgi:transposase InsO family protein